MYKILIDNGVTYLFVDTGTHGIDSKGMAGFLINNNEIKKLIQSIPISEYYINIPNETKYRVITKEQALFVYNEIIKAHSVITLTDEEVINKKDILIQGFLTFCNKNVKTVEEKSAFHKNMLYRAFCSENGQTNEKSISDNIKIYQTLGLDKAKLIQYRGVGEHNLKLYDSYLGNYGLNMNIRLSNNQISLLQSEIEMEQRKI